MTDAVRAGRPSIKDRFPRRFLHFFEQHPTYVKAYVPIIVTISLAIQITQGCR